jgi:hypothetical protein
MGGTGLRQTLAGAGLLLASILCAVFGVLASQRLRNGADSFVAGYSRIDSPLAPGFAAWQDSRNSPTALDLDVYLWNLTNAAAFLDGAAPELQQVRRERAAVDIASVHHGVAVLA